MKIRKDPTKEEDPIDAYYAAEAAKEDEAEERDSEFQDLER